VAKNIHDHVGGSKTVISERRSHHAMWEERGRYMETLDRFMDSARRS
jgi:hypothetical protein